MIRAAFALALLAAPALAQEAGGRWAAGSEAQPWGLSGEEPARFFALVVDPLCVTAGDCPADCGGGDRQLALFRVGDGAIVPVLKNGQPLFTGGVEELLPFCGMGVEVDGLLVGEEGLAPAKFYQIQRLRPITEMDGAFRPADRWTEAWAARNAEAATAEGPWYRNDPGVAARIEEDGYLGLGVEADAAFIEEWF